MPAKLLTLKVCNPAYQPDFKPLQGSLVAIYNGTTLKIAVDGTDIFCGAETKERYCNIKYEQLEPSGMTWEEILEQVLASVICMQITHAVNQVNYQKSEGIYHEH